jgi:hypothetical protein
MGMECIFVFGQAKLQNLDEKHTYFAFAEIVCHKTILPYTMVKKCKFTALTKTNAQKGTLNRRYGTSGYRYLLR